MQEYDGLLVFASVRFNSPLDPPAPHSCYRRAALDDRFGVMVTSLRVFSFNCRGFKFSQDDINLLAVQADIVAPRALVIQGGIRFAWPGWRGKICV